MPREQPPGQAAAPDALAGAATLLLLGLAALAAAPALAAGAAAAHQLRKRGLRWTWTIVPAGLGTPFLVAFVPNATDTAATAAAALAGKASPPTFHAVAAALASYAAATPFATAAIMLWRQRHDHLHGGEAARTANAAQGPLARRRFARARARAEHDGPFTPEGILLGTDEHGAPVRIPPLQAHATIVGGSNSGKTNTAMVLLEGQVAGGGGFVVLDGKGGRDLPKAAVALSRQYGRDVQLWSLEPYGDPELDEYRCSWNPCGGGNATEVKDRIASTEEQTEPYYAALASRGLLVAARAFTDLGEVPCLDELADLLDQPAKLLAALGGEGAASADAEWVRNLQPKEASALKGMGTRLRTMVGSDGGAALLPSASEVDLLDAIDRNALVVFTLPQGSYPETIPHVTRYLLQALNAVCGRLEAKGTRADAMVFVDELSAFDGDQLCSGLERGRSAGVRYVVATQSLSNFASTGGDKLLHAALDNAELLVIHRQAVPDSVELLASIGGTEEQWEHTHQVAGVRFGPGLDETGVRARRLTDRFVAHPNVIKRVGLGEAILVAQHPRHRVRRVAVRRASSSRKRDAFREPADAYRLPPLP